MNYWQITLWDGEKIRVSPKNTDFVKKKMAAGDGHIITKSRTIAVKDIKTFEETSVLYIPRTKQLESGELLEKAAHAFNEPVYSDDGESIVTKWVKKRVTRKEFASFYYPHGYYYELDGDENYVTMAFTLPVHLIDTNRVSHCTSDDIRALTKR